MSQAFYTAIGGISASQKKIDVIADNIANMNTVAFKESNAYFETVFSRTLSLGGAPTSSYGGTNPMQVGLGVQLSSIDRNFANGTSQSTGRVSDLYIEGKGFFCVEGGSGEILLTRAGNFNIDPTGNLVTSNGERVLGTDTLYSTIGSNIPVIVPTMLSITSEGNSNALDLGSKDLSRGEVNNLAFKDGTFRVITQLDDTNRIETTVDITGQDTLNDIITTVNAALNADLNTYSGGALGPANNAVQLRISSTTPGAIEFVLDTTQDINGAVAGSPSVQGLMLESIGSNFTDETKLASAAPTTSGTDIIYTSKVLDYKGVVGPADNILEANSLVSFNISADGSIEAMYSNGDKLTVEARDNLANSRKYLVLELPGGISIKEEDLTINADMIEAANLQLQLASVVNEKGLLSEGGNSFSVGPNTGEITYSIGNDNGFGGVKSGGLESSNVDLPTQFAEMIVTQRAIEANSRAFDTVSQILQRIVSLGR